MFVPTYEYECLKCRKVFEVKQRISEAPLTTCETCGGTVRRLLSPAPFILKGEGWYVTDYPSEARKKARESEKSADTKAPESKASAEKSSGEKSSKASAEKSSGEKSSTSSPGAGSAATPSTTPSGTSTSGT